VLCDFGLSRVKADIASRTTETELTSIAGSRNFMAPERLNGGALRKPCDIYAFGMVIYEVNSGLTLFLYIKSSISNQVQTKEIPLASLSIVSYIEFKDLIIRQDIRPERPEDDEAPQMTDALWQLAERCWTKLPAARPKADTVCDAISSELGDTKK
jgi:serine/threonine protein kinase